MINGKLFIRQDKKSILVRVTFELLLVCGGCQANRLKDTDKPRAYVSIVLFTYRQENALLYVNKYIPEVLDIRLIPVKWTEYRPFHYPAPSTGAGSGTADNAGPFSMIFPLIYVKYGA